MPETKKKILYIVTQAEWGGAQKYIFDLATNLANNFDITVATGSSGQSQELLNQLQVQGIKTVVFKHIKREIYPCQDLMAIREITHFLKQNKFDIIHLNSSKAGVIGAIAGRISKTPKIIYTAHGWVFEEQLPFYKRWLYLLMEKLASQLRDTTIVLSEKEKNIALKNKTAKQKSLFVIPNGIDLEKIKFLGKEEARQEILRFAKLAQNDIKKDAFLIGTIANFYKTKGLDILLESFKEIIKINPNAKLVIIGDGPERNNLVKQIQRNNLYQHVILTGLLPEAYKYLWALDIFVLSSIKEGFPYAILEAMAAKLPIVATSVGAIPEILQNQKNALIVPPNNYLALSSALKELIQNPQQAEGLAKEAHDTVQQFNLATTLKKTSSLY